MNDAALDHKIKELLMTSKDLYKDVSELVAEAKKESYGDGCSAGWNACRRIALETAYNIEHLFNDGIKL